MKTFSPRLRPLAAAILCSVIAPLVPTLHAQTTATTDPVGFITETVSGGTPASPKLTLISPTLMQPVAWQGLILTISGTTINVTGTPWTANQFNGASGKFFVEVVDPNNGTSAGAWTDITGTTTSSITTMDNLSAFASAGTSIRIRKHVTIGSFLGVANSAGLKGGTSAASADEVLVYDGANTVIYWYYDASDAQGPAGWYDLSYNPSENVVIAPHQGVVIKRKTAGNVVFTSMGSVKTGNTYFRVNTGLNVLGTVSAKGLTLANSGLYNANVNLGLKGSNSPSVADQVTIYTLTGQTIYWYYDASDAQGPAGWYDLSYNPADTVAIAPGTSLVINRRTGNPVFNWKVPSPTSF